MLETISKGDLAIFNPDNKVLLIKDKRMGKDASNSFCVVIGTLPEIKGAWILINGFTIFVDMSLLKKVEVQS